MTTEHEQFLEHEWMSRHLSTQLKKKNQGVKNVSHAAAA